MEVSSNLTKLDPSDRVAEGVKRGRPEGNAHNVWDHEEDGAAHPWLGGEPHLEGELPAVVVHAAAVHQAQDVPHIRGVQHLVPGGGAHPAIGQGRPHHWQGLRVYLHAAGLEVQVQCLVEVSSFRETILFLHKVAHGEVSVRSCPLWQKDRIVEPEKLITLKGIMNPFSCSPDLLPPSLWRLLNKKSYLSARLDLGSILLSIKAQDIMAPPFNIGLWGLSENMKDN